MLSKKEILAAKDIKSESVYVQYWGGEVRVDGMTGKERGVYDDCMVKLEGQTRVVTMEMRKLVLASLCLKNEDGSRMFDGDEIEDLAKKSTQAIEIIAAVAERLSGLGIYADSLAKNSASEANEGSGSASPDTSKQP